MSFLNAVSVSTSSSSKTKESSEDVDEKGRHIEPEEEDFECVPCEAGGIVEPKRHLGNPAQVEIDEHNLTHCAYRSWCPICVEAHGREDPHCRATKEDVMSEAPVVSMDYKEISEYEMDKALLIAIICRDEWTKAVAAHVVKAKGSIECSRRFVEFLDSFGYNESVLKFDNESAIKVLRDEVIAKRQFQ